KHRPDRRIGRAEQRARHVGGGVQGKRQIGGAEVSRQRWHGVPRSENLRARRPESTEGLDDVKAFSKPHGLRTQSYVSVTSGPRSTTSKSVTWMPTNDCESMPRVAHFAVLRRSSLNVSAMLPPSERMIPYVFIALRRTFCASLNLLSSKLALRRKRTP